MTPSKWAAPAAFCPPRMSAVNDRSPSTTSYMAVSPTTCPFRLACRQRTSPTYEPTGPSLAKPSRRPNGGCGAGGGGAVTPHFVKVISTGRLSWLSSDAKAGDIWTSNATAPTNEATRLWTQMVFIELLFGNG